MAYIQELRSFPLYSFVFCPYPALNHSIRLSIITLSSLHPYQCSSKAQDTKFDIGEQHMDVSRFI